MTSRRIPTRSTPPDGGREAARRLGVAGKKCLWIALREVRGAYPELERTDLERLIERASSQERELERERLSAAATALARG